MTTTRRALPIAISLVIQAAALALIFSSTDLAGLQAAESTPTTVTLSWTAPGDDSSTGQAWIYDIRYSLSVITDANWASATKVTGIPAPKPAGSAESYVVTGLTPNTAYYFALKTGDEVPNWSVLSNVIQKSTTQETTPPAAITNLAAPSATQTAVTLTWTAPGNDSITGTASTYDLRYSTAPITSANFASATQVAGVPAPKTAGSAETFTVSGLTMSTTYYFAIKTADAVPNWSGLSNVVTKATLGDLTAPSAIANLGASNETSTSVTLSWTAPGDDGNVGTATTYDIRYSTSNITAGNFSAATQVANEPSPKAAGSAETFVVTGLASGTGYFFAVKTADEVPNWSGLSNVVSRTTTVEQIPPATITNLAASTSGQNFVTLTWTAPGNDSITGTASQYDIRYSTSPITASTWGSALQVNGEPTPKAAGSAESFSVTGLAMSTTYYFAIKTADGVPNWSGMSNVVSRPTTGDITPPAGVTDLSALPGTNNGDLLLHWTAPGNDSMTGIAAVYIIRYSTSAINDANFNSAMLVTNPPLPLVAGSSQTSTIRNLVGGMNYYVALKTLDQKSNMSVLSNVAQGSARLIINTGTNDQIADLVSPPINGVVPSAHPTLCVTAVGSNPATSYAFEVASDSSFVGLVTSGLVSQGLDTVVSWRVPVNLNPNENYYWRAHAAGYSYSPTGIFSVAPKTHIYPNPFRPSSAPAATFTDLPAGSELVLLTVSGEPVRHWSALSGSDITWDGTNEQRHPVATGTYLWYVADTQVSGKIIVIR